MNQTPFYIGVAYVFFVILSHTKITGVRMVSNTAFKLHITTKWFRQITGSYHVSIDNINMNVYDIMNKYECVSVSVRVRYILNFLHILYYHISTSCIIHIFIRF